jgi:ADP-dependent NAD(P)H-hydrate dehydratase / NAD(P)H-hydrate epimerase
LSPRSLSLSQFYPKRKSTVRKGDFGRVVIAGGSDHYAGCLAFNALGALRTGADLAIVVAPKRAADIVAGFSPDLITVPCDSPYPDPKLVSEASMNCDSLVIGAGVVRNPLAHGALRDIIQRTNCPIVADAEALHALASNPEAGKGKKILLTPNVGEFQILAGKPWPGSGEQKIAAVKSLAECYRATVLVKGSVDFISDGNRVHLDMEGSSFMTKGGYGDILAGVAGALLGRGHSTFDSARAAAFLVGRAGDMASKRFGEGTLASDALSLLPTIISKGQG